MGKRARIHTDNGDEVAEHVRVTGIGVAKRVHRGELDVERVEEAADAVQGLHPGRRLLGIVVRPGGTDELLSVGSGNGPRWSGLVDAQSARAEEIRDSSRVRSEELPEMLVVGHDGGLGGGRSCRREESRGRRGEERGRRGERVSGRRRRESRVRCLSALTQSLRKTGSTWVSIARVSDTGGLFDPNRCT